MFLRNFLHQQARLNCGFESHFSFFYVVSFSAIRVCLSARFFCLSFPLPYGMLASILDCSFEPSFVWLQSSVQPFDPYE